MKMFIVFAIVLIAFTVNSEARPGWLKKRLRKIGKDIVSFYWLLSYWFKTY